MEWHEAVQVIRPYVYRIVTPRGSGTGFLVSNSSAGDLLGIATAAHVVSHAHEWGEHIRIEHFESGVSITLPPSKRVVLLDESRDTAALVFEAGEAVFPKDPPTLLEKEKTVKTGVEVGWLGFPAVSPRDLCFFSGRISCVIGPHSTYLVDGVAINGVSGGPTLWLGAHDVRYVGVVSAYIPNRVTGEALPGLAVVQDVLQFHDVVTRMKNLDDARAVQAQAEAASETQARDVPDSQ